ncbi:hypothetical protein H8E77_34110, partial [bacterium]|nr:hypothetical protein [bacterium]
LILLNTVVCRLSCEELTVEQLDVLLETLEMLQKRPLTYMKLNQSEYLLEKVGIDTRLIRFTDDELKWYLKGI